MSIDVCFSGKTEGEINVCSKAKCQMQTDKECLVCLVVFPLYCSPACDAATRSGERRILTKRSIDFSCDAHALDRGRHMNVVCMYIVCWRFKHVQTAYKKVSTWEKDPLSWFFIFLYIYIFFIFISFRGDSERTDTGSRGKRHSAGHNPRAPAVAAMVMARGLSQSC